LATAIVITSEIQWILTLLFGWAVIVIAGLIAFSKYRKRQKNIAPYLVSGPIQHEIGKLLKALHAKQNCNAPLKHLEVLVSAYVALAGRDLGPINNLNFSIDASQNGIENAKKYQPNYYLWFEPSDDERYLDFHIGAKTALFDIFHPTSDFEGLAQSLRS
jgi:hypothetical protein